MIKFSVTLTLRRVAGWRVGFPNDAVLTSTNFSYSCAALFQFFLGLPIFFNVTVCTKKKFSNLNACALQIADYTLI
jgi:hypothetical protein